MTSAWIQQLLYILYICEKDRENGDVVLLLINKDCVFIIVN